MKITVQDLFDKYDLERYLKTGVQVDINTEAVEERIAEEIDYSFDKGNINRNDLKGRISLTILEYLEGLTAHTTVGLDEFANHDTIEIEEE